MHLKFLYYSFCTILYYTIFFNKLDCLFLAGLFILVKCFGKDRSLPELGTFMAPHSKVGSWPYLKTLDLAGKACQGKTL